MNQITSVYGPVKSWRYGTSLGIDPIGNISTCSFNCVYCQLGEIEKLTETRSLFVPTTQIVDDLQNFSLENVDIITLSGSGEPTLAINLGEILQHIKSLTAKPILVLTNGSLLTNPIVRKELAIADFVSVKLDAICQDQLRRINRPIPSLNWSDIYNGILKFSQEYQGKLGIQTMILSPPDNHFINEYIGIIRNISPQEIQLNTPSRPKPLQRQLEGRGNHQPDSHVSYAVRKLNCVSPQVLANIADSIQSATGIFVRYKQ